MGYLSTLKVPPSWHAPNANNFTLSWPLLSSNTLQLFTVMCLSYSLRTSSYIPGPASSILHPANCILQPADYILGHVRLCLGACGLYFGDFHLQVGRFKTYLENAHLCLKPLSLYLGALDKVGSLGDGLLQAV